MDVAPKQFSYSCVIFQVSNCLRNARPVEILACLHQSLTKFARFQSIMSPPPNTVNTLITLDIKWYLQILDWKTHRLDELESVVVTPMVEQPTFPRPSLSLHVSF